MELALILLGLYVFYSVRFFVHLYRQEFAGDEATQRLSERLDAKNRAAAAAHRDRLDDIARQHRRLDGSSYPRKRS